MPLPSNFVGQAPGRAYRIVFLNNLSRSGQWMGGKVEIHYLTARDSVYFNMAITFPVTLSDTIYYG